MSKVTLGGDRVGSGNHMKQELHNYERSNHNLSCSRVTSMAVGALYPMYVNIGLTGDTFDIDLNAFVRTLPTEGPMFGAYKLQADVYTADVRLYQAILHNNTTEIGMDMDQVLFPKVELDTHAENKSRRGEFNPTSLMRYLGITGIGRSSSGNGMIKRKFNAVPILAYYDTFKSYYANKQEENAYVIMSGEITEEVTTNITKIDYGTSDEQITLNTVSQIEDNFIAYAATHNDNLIVNPNFSFYLYGSVGNIEAISALVGENEISLTNQFIKTQKNGYLELEYVGELIVADAIYFTFEYQGTQTTGQGSIRLQEFPLKNIDLMRKRLLTSWDLGEEVVIKGDETLLPYQAVTGTREHTEIAPGYQLSKNCDPMQGLVVKCYQSDMYNNWLDTEWVNKITDRSKVNVSNGSFTIDALNMAKKIYNHYNRVAITGGSYDDWQLAAYGEENYGKSEKPVYHGGMSSEVVFDEVVSSVASGDGENFQPLGTLGGRGTLKTRKGGHVIIKCKEACVVMVIVSLTPRLTYSQGNAWYMTELDSMDDLHKPEFDRIGFQDLMVENMAWWDTIIDETTGQLTRTSAGKQTGWIHYQTDVDKCYGDFAAVDGKGYMVLQRLYDQDPETGGVADVTTYIDPTKYNYPFAVRSLAAQNFWTFLSLDIKARRKMSAKQIPNV